MLDVTVTMPEEVLSSPVLLLFIASYNEFNLNEKAANESMGSVTERLYLKMKDKQNSCIAGENLIVVGYSDANIVNNLIDVDSKISVYGILDLKLRTAARGAIDNDDDDALFSLLPK